LWLLRNSHRKRAQTSSQKTPQKEAIPRLAQMGRIRQKKNQKLKDKSGLDFDVDSPLPSEQAEERIKNREAFCEDV